MGDMFNSINSNGGCVRDNKGLEIKNDFNLPECSGDCVSDNPCKFKSVESPFYSHKLHQSGVNSVSLITKGKTLNAQLYLCISKNRNYLLDWI